MPFGRNVTGGTASTDLPEFISGLRVIFDATNGISVSTGSAYIQSAAAILVNSAVIAKAGLALAATTWYYVYLFDNAGTADVEVSTTAPAAAYSGTARSKTGDTSRRFIGCFVTDSGSLILRFVQDIELGYQFYVENGYGGQKAVVNGGAAVVQTNVSCAAIVPPVSNCAYFRGRNFDTTGTVGIGPAYITITGTNYEQAVGANALTGSGWGWFFVHLDNSQQLAYYYISGFSTGTFTLSCLGFDLPR